MDLVHRVDFAVVRMADLLERRWTRGAGLNWFRVLWKEFIMGIEFSGTGRNGSVFFIKIDFHFRVEYSASMFESLHVLL